MHTGCINDYKAATADDKSSHVVERSPYAGHPLVLHTSSSLSEHWQNERLCDLHRYDAQSCTQRLHSHWIDHSPYRDPETGGKVSIHWTECKCILLLSSRDGGLLGNREHHP